MKCPACFNELSKLQVGALTVDVCQGGCGGIWFDAFELQRVDEEHEEPGERLVEIQRDERIVVDASRKRECPRCPDVKLKRHFFSAKRAEKSQTAEAKKVAQSSVSSDVIRYLYRMQSESRKAI